MKHLPKIIKYGTYSDYGTLRSVKIEQDEGLFWVCTLEWSTEKDNNTGNEYPEGSSYGPKYSTLTVRMNSMPLENKRGYRTNWNYHLAAKKGTSSVPKWWDTTKELALSDSDADKYRWIREPGEIPEGWKIIKKKTKPGVECWQLPIYELTENSKHGSSKSAGWAVAKKSGKISNPSNGDFNITSKLGGNWLCEGGSVQYDGKNWIATCTFAHSPTGWDKDLYDED